MARKVVRVAAALLVMLAAAAASSSAAAPAPMWQQRHHHQHDDWRPRTLLVFPLSERTHMLVHLKLATTLALRGHRVLFMTADCHQAFAEQVATAMLGRAAAAAAGSSDNSTSSGSSSDNSTMPAVDLAFVPYAMSCEYHEEEKAKARRLDPLSEVVAILNNVVGRADDVLSDVGLMARLEALVAGGDGKGKAGGKAGGVDLLVADVLSYGMVLAARLGNLPHVDVDVGTAGALWEAVFYGAEPGASFVPAVGTFFPTTGMSLWQRAANLVATKASRGLIAWAYWGRSGPLQRLLRKHNVSVPWPYDSALLLLTNSNFATEPPRAVAPNTKYVGPVLPEPPAPLPPQLDAWISGAAGLGQQQQNNHSKVVVVSFGGTLDAPLAASRVLAAAMRRLPDVRFVWKLAPGDAAALRAEGALDGVEGVNALVASWLPQNDLLGHPSVAAFVTQGGYLSMGEAAYHGVPVLGLPFLPGQGEQIVAAVDQGRGRRLPGGTLRKGRVDAFVAELRALLADGGAARAAAVTAARLRAAPAPYAQQAAEWVEFAARVAPHGPYLHPAKVRQWWHQQAMLDVALLLAALAAVPLLLLWRAGNALRWRLLAARLPPRQQQQRAWFGAPASAAEVVASITLRPVAGGGGGSGGVLAARGHNKNE